MKRNKRHLLALLSCFLVCLTIHPPTFALEPSADSVDAAAVKNQESLYTSIRFKEQYTSILLTRTTQDSEIHYPDNYGGMYIDDDDELHINYTTDKASLTTAVTEDEASFDQVEYSFNDLFAIYNCLSENATALSISETYVDEINNRVVVAVNQELFDDVIAF